MYIVYYKPASVGVKTHILRPLDDINECAYDPPYIGKGSAPGWADGSKNTITRVTGPTIKKAPSEDYYDESYYYDYRRRRETEEILPLKIGNCQKTFKVKITFYFQNCIK